MFFKRIITAIILFLVVLTTPWWVTLACAGIAALYFDSYYELIGTGLLLDLLYGAPFGPLYGSSYVFVAMSAIFLIALEVAKPHMRFFSTPS